MKRVISLFVIFFLASSVMLVAPVVRAQTLFFDEDGAMYIEDGEVLGEKSEEPKRKENELPKTQVQPDQNRGQEKERRDTRTTNTTKITEETRVEAGGAAQVKQRVSGSSGTRSIEAKDGKLEVQFERKDQKEPGEKTAVTSIRVRERSDTHEVEIKAGKDGIELEQQKVRTKTTVPISVGAHNELIVKTQAGEKEVGVLPDAAVQKLLEKGILSQTQTTAGTGDSQAKQEVTLTERNGTVEYTVKGEKQEKFLGLFPVTTQVEARVSAETGAITSVSQAWYQTAFGFLFR